MASERTLLIIAVSTLHLHSHIHLNMKMILFTLLIVYLILIVILEMTFMRLKLMNKGHSLCNEGSFVKQYQVRVVRY